MQRQHISRNGYGNVGTQTLYLVDLERRVRSFNNKAREAGIDLHIRLTGDSEEYAYYADLILTNKIGFLSLYTQLATGVCTVILTSLKKTWIGTIRLGICGGLKLILV